MKKKDNLTEVVEDLQKRPVAEPEGGRQQVINNDGEIITLGQKGRIKIVSKTNRKSIELSIEEVKEMIKPALKEVLMEDMVERVYQKFLEKLREKLQ